MNLKLALCVCLFLYPLIGNARIANSANEENNLLDSPIERLIISLSKETIDTSKVKILNEIAWHYSPSQSDKAIQFADSALSLAEKLGWQKGQAEALSNLGDAYRFKGDIKISLENYQNALTLFKQTNDRVGIANTFASIGNDYYLISDFPKALGYFNRSLKISEEIKYKRGIAKAYSYRAILHSAIKDFKNAIENFNKAIKIFTELKDSASLGVQLGNLGLAHTELREYKTALGFYEKAIKIFKKLDDLYNLSLFLGNMGLAYTEIGNYSKAQDFLERSLSFSVQIKDEYGIAYQYGFLGKLKLKIAADKNRTNSTIAKNNNLKESIDYLSKAVDKFKALGVKEEQKNFLFSLSEAYKLNNDFQNALIAYSSARVLQDSIFSADNKKMIAELEIQKELELKEKRIELLNKEKDYQSNYTKLALALAVLFIIVSLFIFYSYRRKRKDNLLLLENILIREKAEEELRLNKIELEKYQQHLESVVVERTKNLETETSQRSRAEKASEESEGKYRLLIELAVDAFFQGDFDGNLVLVNSKATELTGYPKEELLKLNIKDLFPSAELEKNPLRYDLLKTGVIIRSERKLLRKDGSEIFIEMNSKKMPEGTFQSFFRDITERKKTEEALLRFNVSWQRLTKATHQLHKVLELPVVLRQLVFSAIKLTGAEDGAAGLLMDGKMVFKEYIKKGNVLPINFSFEKGYGVPGWVWETGNSYLTNDTESDSHVIQEIRRTLGFYNLLDTPIINGQGEIVGCFELHNKPGGFDEHDLMLLQNLAASTSIAIENSRMILRQKQAEEKIKISEQTYRGIINSIDEAIYIQDKDGTFLDVNNGAVRMYGYTSEELIGKNPLFVSAEGKNDLEMVGKKIALAFEGNPQEFEFWGKRKNGEIFPKNVRLYKGMYFEKDVIIAVAQDITEKKQADQKLKESEELFRNLVENITDVFYITDKRGKMKYCSPNFFLFTGFLPQEILNHSYVRVVAPVDQRMVVEHYIEAERSGIFDTRIELRVKRKDGIIFWAEQNTRFVRDEKENILEYRTVARDISERKHAEEALKKSEEWFRNLFEKASDGIFHLSLRGELLAVNKAFAMMHGYTVEEMQKMSINDLDTPQTSILFPERMRRVLAGENLTFEVEHYHKNGHTFQLEVTASMITVGNEKFVIAFHRDISERKKAEETIRASEERFRTISYLTSDYIFSTKICSDGKVEPDWVMGAFEKITGYTFEEYKAIGGWYALLHPDDRKKDADDFQKLLNNKKVISEVQIYSKNGSIIWLRTYAQPIWDESSDRISYVHGAVQDITERKYSESLISESEEKFRKIAEGTKAILFNTNTRGQITYANRAACAMLGLDEENLMGKFYLSFVHPDDRKKVHSYFLSQLKNNEQARSLDFRYVSATGNVGWLSFLVNILYKDDKITGLTGVAQDISERKQSEEALKRSEYQYRNLFETANDAIVIFEPDTEIILEANPKACDIYGFAKNELIGLSLKTISINVTAGEKQIQQTLNLKRFKNFETQHINRGGRIISFLINASFIEFEGKPAILSINHDITDRKIAEEKLYNSELQFRTVWENSADGMRLTNSDGIILMVNKAFCKLVDMQKSELEGKAFEVVYRIDTREHISQSHKKSFSLRDFESYFERELILWNGKKYWFEVTNSFIEIEKQPAMLLSIFRDVTQRKLDEFELRKLSEAVEQSPASIVITNIDGSIQYVNKSFSEITGYRLDEVAGKNAKILSSGNTTKEEYQNLWETILAGKEWRGEFLNKKKNGELFWEDAIIKAIKDKDGEIINFLAVKEDITLKKKAEQKIQLLAHSLESISECVSITDTENHLLFVNEAFIKTYGYTKEELFGQHISIVSPAEGLRVNNKQICSSTLAGGWRGEVLNRRKDGAIFPISLSTSVVKDNDGNPIALIGVASDITDMKKSREELISAKDKAENANKLKTEFLAQMSHEIRSPMNVVLSFSSLIKDELAEVLTPELVDCFKAIDNSGRRLIRTVDLILNMSEAQMGTYEPTWSNVDLIADVIENIQLEYISLAKRKGLEFNYKTEVEEAVVLGDHNSLNQIFVNLVDNAIKYTNEGKVEIIVDRDNDDNLRVNVADTGIGISEEFKKNLFEPFMQEERGYSRRFEGNGLGLALVKKYCDMNKAEIRIESEKGKGSSFIVTFNSEVKN